MSMSKKDFIALASLIKRANTVCENCEAPPECSDPAIETLADFCQSQNPAFNRDRWLDYIAGKCGPSGGSIK